MYRDVYDAIDDGIFEESDILVFWGKRGKGKSSIMTKFSVDFMKAENAQRRLCTLTYPLCERLNAMGINVKPPSDHAVFVDTYAVDATRENGAVAYEFKLKNFGVPTNKFKPSLICPGGVYAFDETQKELDSHNGALPIHFSAAFEFSRHCELFLMLAMQRGMRLPKDIRDLATFIEIVGHKNYYNKYFRISKTVWKCNIIYNNAKFEKYIDSFDKQYIDKTVEFEFNGDIYECYDSHYYMPMFFTGMENEGLVLQKTEKVQFTKEYMQAYAKKNLIEEEENVDATKRNRKTA